MVAEEAAKCVLAKEEDADEHRHHNNNIKEDIRAIIPKISLQISNEVDRIRQVGLKNTIIGIIVFPAVLTLKTGTIVVPVKRRIGITMLLLLEPILWEVPKKGNIVQAYLSRVHRMIIEIISTRDILGRQ